MVDGEEEEVINLLFSPLTHERGGLSESAEAFLHFRES